MAPPPESGSAPLGEAGLAPGTVLGAYTIVRLLGAGGMGAVYEAVHRALDKRVALKTLHPEYARVPELAERFLREGRAASRLRHPNVVDVTDVGEANGTTFLVMAYLDGESLSSLARREAPISAERAVELLLPVLSAIATAHDEGVIHRDLKPENIVLARDRLGRIEPKVLDFGISKLSRADALTRTAAHMGTPHYMAPELAQGAREASPASDQWALGAIAFRLLTGRLLADHENAFAVIHAIASGRYAKLRELRPELPVAFAAAIDRSLAVQPEQRFASVVAFGAALLPFAPDGVRARWAPSFGDAGEAPTAIPSGDVGRERAGSAGAPLASGAGHMSGGSSGVRSAAAANLAASIPASVEGPSATGPGEVRVLSDARLTPEPAWATDAELDARLASRPPTYGRRVALAATLGVAAVGILAALVLMPGPIEVEQLDAVGEAPAAASSGAAAPSGSTRGAAAGAEALRPRSHAPSHAPSGAPSGAPNHVPTEAPGATSGSAAAAPEAGHAPTPAASPAPSPTLIAPLDARPADRLGAPLDGLRGPLPGPGAPLAGGDGARTATPSAARPRAMPRPLPTRGNPGRRVILAP